VAVRRRLKIEDDFILFVGTIEPRKNLKMLLRAFARILKETPLRPQLVIAGCRGLADRGIF
jgi:glycosyltransferase involved in cell wall biosynthesis